MLKGMQRSLNGNARGKKGKPKERKRKEEKGGE